MSGSPAMVTTRLMSGRACRRQVKTDPLRDADLSRGQGEVGVECGGLGGDPPSLSGGTDADQGDRAGGGCSKNTRCGKALAADGPPSYRRQARGSVVDAVEPRIRELLQACPTMPATVIAERIGWRYSIRTLSGRVAELRPIYLPPDPASRTSYLAGEIVQCDFWFPPIWLPVGFGQTRTAK